MVTIKMSLMTMTITITKSEIFVVSCDIVKCRTLLTPSGTNEAKTVGGIAEMAWDVSDQILQILAAHFNEEKPKCVSLGSYGS